MWDGHEGQGEWMILRLRAVSFVFIAPCDFCGIPFSAPCASQDIPDTSGSYLSFSVYKPC